MQSRLSFGWVFLPGTGVWVKGGLQRDEEEKKKIHFIISERLWNELGSDYKQKGQATPQDALISPVYPAELPPSNCTRMKIVFLLDHSLFLWQTKGMLQKIQSPGWKETAKDHSTYAQDGTKRGLQMSLPSRSSFQLCNSAFYEHCWVAADVHTGVLSCRCPLLCNIIPHLPHAERSVPQLDTRTFTEDQEGECRTGASRLKVFKLHWEDGKALQGDLSNPNFTPASVKANRVICTGCFSTLPFNKMATVVEICFVKYSEIYSLESWSQQVCYSKDKFVVLFVSIRLVTMPGD